MREWTGETSPVTPRILPAVFAHVAFQSSESPIRVGGEELQGRLTGEFLCFLTLYLGKRPWSEGAVEGGVDWERR